MKLHDTLNKLCRAFTPTASAQDCQTAGQMLIPHGEFSPGARLEVYRDNITGAQQRVMEMLFPVCRQILGEQCFNNMSHDYAWSEQANCADLNHYGKNFPQWFEEQQLSHKALVDYQYIADLARFEWQWHQTLFSRDDPLFDIQQLFKLHEQGIEDVILQPAHSLSLFTSQWPVHEIWLSHLTSRPKMQYQNTHEREYLVIYRRHAVKVQTVSKAIFEFLSLCQQSISLPQIISCLADQAEECFAQLPEMIQNGWITGVSSNTERMC